MSNEKQTWFTADLHFGHTNILKFDPRPFGSIQEHDDTIMANFQSVIKPWDDVYILGDLAYKIKKAQIEAYLIGIPGNKKFIRGNHDHHDTRKLYEKYGEYLGEQKTVKVEWAMGTQEIVLNHYPMRSWDRAHYGETWHLYGHHHGGLALGEHGIWGKSMDVGINTNFFLPYSMQIIYDKIGHLEPMELQGDHHSKNKRVVTGS